MAADLVQLQEEFTRATAKAEQPPVIDVSVLENQEDLHLVVKNLYHIEFQVGK